MKKIIIPIFLIVSFKSFGQIDGTSRILSSAPGISATLRANNVFDPNKNNNTIQGTPYSTENYLNGKIESINAPIIFKYNANRDAIEFKEGDKIYDLPKELTYSPIIFGNKKMILINDNGNLSYYTELYGGSNISLLRKDKINLVSAKESNGYNDDTSAKFSSIKTDYFYKIGDKISPFPKNKKSLTSELKTNKEVEDFINKNSNYVKDENKLIELVKILDKTP